MLSTVIRTRPNSEVYKAFIENAPLPPRDLYVHSFYNVAGHDTDNGEHARGIILDSMPEEERLSYLFDKKLKGKFDLGVVEKIENKLKELGHDVSGLRAHLTR